MADVLIVGLEIIGFVMLVTFLASMCLVGVLEEWKDKGGQ